MVATSYLQLDQLYIGLMMPVYTEVARGTNRLPLLLPLHRKVGWVSGSGQVGRVEATCDVSVGV